MKLLFFFSIYIVCIFSCVSVTKKDILYVYLTDSSRFVLLPPGAIEQDMDMAQFLSTEFRGQNFFLNVWVKANEDAIDMVFFNEMGASIGELSYRDGAVRFSSTVFPVSVLRAFQPEYVIADFQLCFYDPYLLSRSLKDSSLVLEIENGNRRILNGNEVIIEIKKMGNTVELVNHQRGYAYTLEGDFHGIQ
jgi:hypothetical protein